MEKKEAFKFTGEDAENYDFYLGPILFEPYAWYLASKIDATNVKSVLEIACGTGRVTRHIRKILPADKKKGFDEIYRVLKPGGKFMCFTWDNTLNMPLFRLLVNDLVVPHFEDEDTTRFFVPFSLHQPKVLTDWMENAGFKNVEINNV